MSREGKTKVVLCWHMHQPQYQNLITGSYYQPWTYLHGIKDYIEMANLLFSHPRVKLVINFSPVLLEQIDDYRLQIEAFFRTREPIKDPLLDLLVSQVIPTDISNRNSIIEKCLRANEQRLIKRYKAYSLLAEIGKKALNNPTLLTYLNDQFFFDLVVWHHLAWFGETVKEKESLLRALVEKSVNFTQQDRFAILELIGKQLAQIIPAYSALWQKNQIEISMNPYSHPIMPLMLDMKSGQEALHDLPLPNKSYPGGEERVRWQLDHGIQVFERYFGKRPVGCWPSEGGVSLPTLNILAESGFTWTASGENVLKNSLAKENKKPECAHNVYWVDGAKISCFFRDDKLSDLIGFTYSGWHADDAVSDLLHHLDTIHNHCPPDHDRIVSIILDGENCWEYYPNNGFYFLSALYDSLSDHHRFELATYNEIVADLKTEHTQHHVLNSLVAGSWVYGTFSTWIGDRGKNLGWELLCEAKEKFDQAIAENRLDPQKRALAEKQLAICEASDWFWWFGDYNAAESVSDFDRLYRVHLSNLYQILGYSPPEALKQAISVGSSTSTSDNAGTMRRGSE